MSPLFLFRAILTWDFKSNLVFSEDRLPFLFISRHLLCDAMDTPTQNRRATVSTRCYWGDVLDTVYTSPILFNLFTGGIFSSINVMLRIPLFLFVLFTRFLFHNELVEVIEYDVMDEVGAMSQPQLLTIDSIYYSPRIKMLSALRG